MAETFVLVLIVPIFLFILAAAAAIGVFVYRDAKARGLPAVPWTICAVILPAFVGVALYLVARTGRSALRCPRCGKRVEKSFIVCPYCGEPLKLSCPGCGAPVEPEWKICPRCAAPLPQREPPVKEKEKGLGWLLALCVVVPLVLVTGLLAMMIFPLNTGGYSVSRVYNTPDGLQEEFPEAAGGVVGGWLDQVEQDDQEIAVLWQKQDHFGERTEEPVEILGCYVYLRGYGTDQLDTRSKGGIFGDVDLEVLVDGERMEGETVCYFQLTADQIATPPAVYVNGRKADIPIVELPEEVELPLLFDFYLTDAS